MPVQPSTARKASGTVGSARKSPSKKAVAIGVCNCWLFFQNNCCTGTSVLVNLHPKVTARRLD